MFGEILHEQTKLFHWSRRASGRAVIAATIKYYTKPRRSRANIPQTTIVLLEQPSQTDYSYVKLSSLLPGSSLESRRDDHDVNITYADEQYLTVTNLT